MENKKEDFQKKLVDKLHKNQSNMESLFLTFLFGGLFLLKFGSSIGAPLMIIGLTTLAVLYYLLAFKRTPNQDANALFFNKLKHISFSTAMIGILFTILNWPNARPILIASFVSMIVIGALELLFSMKKNREPQTNSSEKLRFIIIFITTTCVLFFYR